MNVKTNIIAPMFLIVDLFCGAGGVTTGFEQSHYAKVIACVNHDPVAIKSHKLNHKNVLHFVEDIRTMRLERLVKHVAKWRALYPNVKLILWGSIECTDFSRAKGGLPRNADSRTLATHLDRYIKALDPDFVQIENVVEFMAWGPMTGKVVKTSEGYKCCKVQFEMRDGRLVSVYHLVPESKNNGKYWLKWRKEINSLGYYDEWREMNAADYGAYTSRNRLFGCFAKHGLPIVWPEATHAKKPRYEGLFGTNLQKWKPVKDVLDFSDEGLTIFRKKPLKEKTLERIYAGLVKYVAGGKENFILKYNSTASSGVHIPPSIEMPCHTIATQNRLGIIKAQFIVQRNGGSPESKIVNTDAPARTITATGGNQDLVQCFLAKYYGTGGNLSSVSEPAGTLTTKDRISKVWLDKQYGGNSYNHQSVTVPAGSITNNPKLCLMATVSSFVMPTAYNNKPVSIQAPCPVITANRKHQYLVNPSWGGALANIESPCPVIIARQDKAPLYMIIAQGGKPQRKLIIGHSICDLKIRMFMHHYGIVDIKMRMLRVDELLKIQGFPDNYKLVGTQTDKKKFIGNSVVPQVVTAWINSMGERMNSILAAA